LENLRPILSAILRHRRDTPEDSPGPLQFRQMVRALHGTKLVTCNDSISEEDHAVVRTPDAPHFARTSLTMTPISSDSTASRAEFFLISSRSAAPAPRWRAA